MRTPADPATWSWSSADSLFLQLIQQAHKRDIKVIIDGVFNHTGTEFLGFSTSFGTSRRITPTNIGILFYHLMILLPQRMNLIMKDGGVLKDYPYLKKLAETFLLELKSIFLQ